MLGLFFVLFVPVPGWSIIIETKSGETIKGTVVREDDTRMRIRLAKSKQEVVVGKNEIAKMQRSVDPKDLAKLHPKEVNGYMTLANKLALNIEDPEAREVALRLYVIAAYLEPKKLGYECLERMSLFAETPEQVRKYKAMAFLLLCVGGGRTVMPASFLAAVAT